eukprot:gene15384-32559_t
MLSSWKKSTSLVWTSSSALYLASEDPAVGAIRLIKSTDTGNTWTLLTSGFSNIPIVKLLVASTVSSGNTIYAGTWIGVYMTSDGGSSLSKLGNGLPNIAVNDMYQSAKSLQIATFGRRVWEVSSELCSKLPTVSPTPRLSSIPIILPTSSAIEILTAIPVTFLTTLSLTTILTTLPTLSLTTISTTFPTISLTSIPTTSIPSTIPTIIPSTHAPIFNSYIFPLRQSTVVPTTLPT